VVIEGEAEKEDMRVEEGGRQRKNRPWLDVFGEDMSEIERREGRRELRWWIKVNKGGPPVPARCGVVRHAIPPRTHSTLPPIQTLRMQPYIPLSYSQSHRIHRYIHPPSAVRPVHSRNFGKYPFRRTHCPPAAHPTIPRPFWKRPWMHSFPTSPIHLLLVVSPFLPTKEADVHLIAHVVRESDRNRITVSSGFALETPDGQSILVTCAHTLEEVRHPPGVLCMDLNCLDVCRFVGLRCSSSLMCLTLRSPPLPSSLMRALRGHSYFPLWIQRPPLIPSLRSSPPFIDPILSCYPLSLCGHHSVHFQYRLIPCRQGLQSVHILYQRQDQRKMVGSLGSAVHGPSGYRAPCWVIVIFPVVRQW
jgi:hypothetical protein